MIEQSADIIYLTDHIEAKLQRHIPLLEMSGVNLAPWQGDSLSWDLENARLTLGRVLSELTATAKSERNVSQLRSAALLRRIHEGMKLAAKRAEKLERKLSKAKRKARGK